MKYDAAFLDKLDKLKVRNQYVKVIVLDYDENGIAEIQGKATQGSISVNGAAGVRRTLNLTLAADESLGNLTNIESLISINKKIRVEVGFDNPFIEYQEKYGDIVWFNCGIFVISTASLNLSTTGYNITITGKDKMVLLDGSVGGTILASTTFSEAYDYAEDGSEFVVYPTIYDIIFEAVHHLGDQPSHKIVINDIDKKGKMIVTYLGATNMYIGKDGGNIWFQNIAPGSYDRLFTHGDIAGYQETDFTYPGDLTLNAGATIKQLLDKIVSILGNYEYFFDLDGNFIFQEKQNYLNKYYSPFSTDADKGELYMKHFSDTSHLYSLTDSESIISLNKTPNFDNIKNDFVVWGQSAESGRPIRLHIAIDEKPERNLFDQETDDYPSLIGKTYEWREELYRQALQRDKDGLASPFYDAELLAEWRNIYDPSNKEWTDGWNPQFKDDPSSLVYWLDFIEPKGILAEYSIQAIGRRSKVLNDTDVKMLFANEIPNFIYYAGAEKPQFEEFGYNYVNLVEWQFNYFGISGQGASAYDKIRELFYQHLTLYNSLNITCIPKYYLEPNNLIHIENKQAGIKGNYSISQFVLPLAYNGTMSITAIEALTRI